MTKKEFVIYILSLYDNPSLCKECQYENKISKNEKSIHDWCSNYRCTSRVLEILKNQGLLKK